MRNYLIKTPVLLKAIYNRCIWHIKDNANSVYITFDDGPHPEITPFILDQLKLFKAKATLAPFSQCLSMRTCKVLIPLNTKKQS